MCSVAALEIRRGDWSAAMNVARESLRLARDLEVPSLIICCFEVLAVVLDKQGQNDSAHRVYSFASAMRRERHYVYNIAGELGSELAELAGGPSTGEVSPEQVYRLIDELIAT
jgi:hypothetical protein